MRPNPLKLVPKPEMHSKVFGSESFINLTRKADLPSPKKFVPTPKADGDVVI